MRQLAGKCGGAVAIEPQTGRILALASSPTYNPNAIEKSFSAITKIRTRGCRFAAPLLDRATQGLYPPGSTFKVVTAAAALDSGAYKPTRSSSTPATARSTASASRTPATPRARRRSARVTLATGAAALDRLRLLQHRQADRRRKILEYAKRFGFYATPTELPADAQSPSGLYKKHKSVRAEAPEVPGRSRAVLAFGGERMLASLLTPPYGRC